MVSILVSCLEDGEVCNAMVMNRMCLERDVLFARRGGAVTCSLD